MPMPAGPAPIMMASWEVAYLDSMVLERVEGDRLQARWALEGQHIGPFVDVVQIEDGNFSRCFVGARFSLAYGSMSTSELIADSSELRNVNICVARPVGNDGVHRRGQHTAVPNPEDRLETWRTVQRLHPAST